MNYIKSPKENKYVLCEFYNGTKFLLSSNKDSDKGCCILLNDYNTNEKGITTMSVTIWESLHSYGRHSFTIEEVTSRIDMKELLKEISATFAHYTFEDSECSISVKMPKNSVKQDFIF